MHADMCPLVSGDSMSSLWCRWLVSWRLGTTSGPTLTGSTNRKLKLTWFSDGHTCLLPITRM